MLDVATSSCRKGLFVCVFNENTNPSGWCQYCAWGQNHIYTKKYSRGIMYLEPGEKKWREVWEGWTGQRVLISENKDQSIKLALGSIRKETCSEQFQTQPTRKTTTSEKYQLLPWGLDWGKGSSSGGGGVKTDARRKRSSVSRAALLLRTATDCHPILWYGTLSETPKRQV